MNIYLYDEDSKKCFKGDDFMRYAAARMSGKGLRLKRKMILVKAAKAVTGAREGTYGSPENNFATIAGLWSTYLGTRIESKDVAAMMILLKVARIRGGQAKEDNWVDIAGYAACGGEVQERETDDM